MARGWESKSVEDQIAEQEARKLAATTPKLSAAEIAKREHIAALQMARSRLLEQLGRVRVAGHRDSLEKALAEIEAQIAKEL